ncbi:MAG: response regulator [Anaerolineae bacterium]|nr:response regulator [Anaerolineae bacterium]
MDKKRTITREEFTGFLRDALNNLYDPVHLRQNPLAGLFGVADRFDAASAIRNILIDAVNALKPGDDESAQSRAWRIYDALSFCYVQQLNQEMAADQLGISARQLRRELRAAFEVLSDQLYEQLGLSARFDGSVAVPQPRETTSALTEELAWLRNTSPEEPTDLRQALPALLEMVRPLAEPRGVGLEMHLADDLARLAAHAVVVDQILLSLLSAALSQVCCKRVSVSVESLRWGVEIEVRSVRSCADAQVLPDESISNLDTAYQLVDLCGGRLRVDEDDASFVTVLTIPAVGQVPVLMIDDNADTLQMLQRYTTNTRYHLTGVRDPAQVFDVAEKLAPQIIVLDVMMPQEDGWKVLARLRQHPTTLDIPVVVCTVLAQETLALSLGASSFIRKPLTRQTFLAALDRQVALMETESR